MQASKIPVTVVGLGRIASLLEKDPLRRKPCTHAGVLFGPWGKTRFQIAAGVDISIDRRNQFSKDWKIEPTLLYPSLSDLPKPKNPHHLLVISTDSESHTKLASQGLKQGYKYLLVEKPVALGKKQAVDLHRLEKEKKAVVWVNHERRYHPQYQFAKKCLLSGEWGKVQRVVASVFTSSKNPGMAFEGKGGGPLFHDGTHALDLLQWLFPKLKIIMSKTFKSQTKFNPERVTAWLKSKPQIEIFFEVSGGREYFQFEIDILTNSHRIILSNDGFQFFQSEQSSLYKGFKSLKQTPFPFPKKLGDSAFLGIYQEIYETIRGNQLIRECNLKDNLEIISLMEDLQKGISFEN